jgi:membrane protein implicated in regulation of membrane protease activity
MEDWLSWVWVFLSILLAIAEIFTSGFFLICFAIGAAIAAVAGFFGLSPVLQFAIFVGASAVCLYFVRPFANRIANPTARAVGTDRLVGRQAIVLETIDPALGRGVVRVDHEHWSADSIDGVPLAEGTMVHVVGIEGTHLKVRLG